MTHRNAVIYVRVSTSNQDLTRQKVSLRNLADHRGWVAKRVFEEKISGNVRASDRSELKKTIEYVLANQIDLVLISEISRLGRRVVDVLTTIETLHAAGISLFVEQFNMFSFENGKENPVVKLLMQMLAMGAEMENNLRRERQSQGIALAKMSGRYSGRRLGAKQSEESLISKYADVVDLLKSSNLSIRRISAITNKSPNTVIKVRDAIKNNK